MSTLPDFEHEDRLFAWSSRLGRLGEFEGFFSFGCGMMRLRNFCASAHFSTRNGMQSSNNLEHRIGMFAVCELHQRGIHLEMVE